MNQTEELSGELIEVCEERETPVEYLCGRAGTGKTYEILRRSAQTKNYAILCASTGIAAINLGAITINSLLRYFDTASLRDSYLAGHLTRIVHRLAKQYQFLALDEGSMVESDQLDYIHRAITEANQYKDVTNPLGIIFIGDFAQLPPVTGKWAFRADCWKKFRANTTRLTKVWRQQDGPFLDALNYAREGNGSACAALLTQAGIRWNSSREVNFEGTTILCKNDGVARHNHEVLKDVPGEIFKVTSERWGRQQSEWGQNAKGEWGIPPSVDFKIGAYVMILSNTPDFSMVNGDCGWIREYDPVDKLFRVELVRNHQLVEVARIVRNSEHSDPPPDWKGEEFSPEEEESTWLPRPHYRAATKKYVSGQVRMFPLRLAYASTCHKSQGLSLDRVQIDLRDNFWSSPAMAYTALSRCRTLEGLRLITDEKSFVRRVNMDPRVRAYL